MTALSADMAQCAQAGGAPWCVQMSNGKMPVNLFIPFYIYFSETYIFSFRFVFPPPVIPIPHDNPDNPLLQVSLPPHTPLPPPPPIQSLSQAPPSYWEAVDTKTDSNLPKYEELFGYTE